MVDWRTLKKIDAHIHILPDSVHEANPDSDDVWVYADQNKYRTMMDGLDIEKAVIMPLNDPWLMSMEFTIDAVHKNLYEMKQRYPGKFYAFAQEHRIPVAIHSYPNSECDRSAAYRIINILEQYPELTVIVSHMGAYQWERLLSTRAYVDISAILPDYVRTYGIERTNEILRMFGAGRLIFATDYPDNRFLQPEEIYGSYFDILNQMDFTQEEAEQIAYGNIEKILNT